MSFIQNLFTSRDNNANAATFVGQQDRIWWNPDTNAFYYSDGNTAGGILITGAGSGNGVPGGVANSVQINNGAGNFAGSTNLTFSSNVLSVGGNVVASYFVGNVSTTGNVVGGNILANNYLYANGSSIFTNTVFSGNIDLGNLYIDNETIGGLNADQDIILSPAGTGRVAHTSAVIPTVTNAYSLGTETERWSNVYIGPSTIYIQDTDPPYGDLTISALSGNLVVGNGTGFIVGDFTLFGNTLSLANSAQDFNIGTPPATGNLNVNRPLKVLNSDGNVTFAITRAGYTRISGPSLPLNEAALTINYSGSDNDATQATSVAGALIHTVPSAGNVGIWTTDTYANAAPIGTAASLIVGRRFRGSLDAPAAVQAGDGMIALAGVGYNGANLNSGPAGLSSGRMLLLATENFTANSAASQWQFRNQASGTGIEYYNLQIDTNGITLPSVANGGNAGAHITFTDGTTMSTAGNVIFGNVTATNILATANITGGNLTITGISNLSSNANVKITGGSSGQALTTDGTGNLSWTGVINSNAVPTYGQFWSNITQTVANVNTEYRFLFNNSDGNNNVTLGTGVSNSRVIINETGLYNIQFSAQINKSGSGSTSSAYIWFKKNGTAVPDSAGFITLDNTIQAVQTWNILANVTTAGDYYEIAYAGSSTNFDFPTLPGNVTVGYPASPSIIITVTPIGA